MINDVVRLTAPGRSRPTAGRRSPELPPRGRVDIGPTSRKQLARLARALRPRSPSPAASGIRRPTKRFSATHSVGEHRELLMDRPRSRGSALQRESGIGLACREEDGPRIAAHSAGENVDKRALAGTVLADERVDFAGADSQRRAAKRVHSAKALVHGTRDEERRARFGGRNGSGWADGVRQDARGRGGPPYCAHGRGEGRAPTPLDDASATQQLRTRSLNAPPSSVPMRLQRAISSLSVIGALVLVGAGGDAPAAPPRHELHALGNPTPLRLARLFGDGMVVQRGARVPVWGWAMPGSKVSISFDSRSYGAVAGQNGGWRVTLPAMGLGGSHTLTVTDGSERLTVRDIVIGDVWICSGQSNMEFALADARGGAAAVASARDSLLRQFKVPRSWAMIPTPTSPVAAGRPRIRRTRANSPRSATSSPARCARERRFRSA